MGTRADFYVGRGPEAEWLGSIAYDGHPYPQNVGAEVLGAATLEDYRLAVATRIAAGDDGTTPDQGWPWPWIDSSTTDYAYAWDDGALWASRFGGPWFHPGQEPEPNADAGGWRAGPFPDMTERQNVATGRRSGVTLLYIQPSG